MAISWNASNGQDSQAYVLLTNTTSNPNFTSNNIESMNKALKTESKMIIGAINELMVTNARVETTVDSFQARFNNVIGPELDNPTLLTNLQQIGPNILEAIVNVNNKIPSSGGSVEIVDNLTSTETTKSLSANQGKELNDKITLIDSDVIDHGDRLDDLEDDFANILNIGDLLAGQSVIITKNPSTFEYTFAVNTTEIPLVANISGTGGTTVTKGTDTDGNATLVIDSVNSRPIFVAGSGISITDSSNTVTISATGEGSAGTGVTVIDNLTSTDASAALSANQGKVLDDKKADRTELPNMTNYATKTDVDNAKYDDTNVQSELGDLDTRLDTVETTLSGLTSYDDTAVKASVTALEGRTTTLETTMGTKTSATDVDSKISTALSGLTIPPAYDDTSVKARIQTIEDDYLTSSEHDHNTLSNRNGDNNFLHITSTEKTKYDGYNTIINNLNNIINGLTDKVSDLEIKIAILENGEIEVSNVSLPSSMIPVGNTTALTYIDTKEVEGTINWTPALNNGKFDEGVVYTATATLTPKLGYTLDNVTDSNIFYLSDPSASVSWDDATDTLTVVFQATTAGRQVAWTLDFSIPIGDNGGVIPLSVIPGYDSTNNAFDDADWYGDQAAIDGETFDPDPRVQLIFGGPWDLAGWGAINWDSPNRMDETRVQRNIEYGVVIDVDASLPVAQYIGGVVYDSSSQTLSFDALPPTNCSILRLIKYSS